MLHLKKKNSVAFLNYILFNFALRTISCNFFNGSKLLKALSFSHVMQLEKELRELTVQRDLSQSQVEELMGAVMYLYIFSFPLTEI